MHSQTGWTFASRGNVLSQLGGTDRHLAVVEKEGGFGKRRVAFFTASPLCKSELWMSNLPAHLPTLLARKIHL